MSSSLMLSILFYFMLNTFNYINLLKKQYISKLKLNILFLSNYTKMNKTTLITFLMLLNFVFRTISIKFNSEKCLMLFSLNNFIEYSVWFKYFLKNSLLMIKNKKIFTIFFDKKLQIFNAYRILNFNLIFYNKFFFSFFSKYLLFFK
jgi:hypothetical protein